VKVEAWIVRAEEGLWCKRVYGSAVFIGELCEDQ
jgi:hypothetical protein